MGFRVCHVHGARRSSTIRREQNHWNFKTGQATKAQREKDRQMAIELRNLEALSFALGLAVGPKWKGRKPACIVAQCSAPPSGTGDTNEGYGSVKVEGSDWE
jgi:hypothetical protein